MHLSRRAFLTAPARQSSRRDVLVYLFQRGAADGLNTVVPYADPHYTALRPRIAVPPPGSGGGAIDLDGFFGLHPAASAALPLFQAGRLAWLPSSGIPHQSRSHFEAQDRSERGVTESHQASSGWLARHLQATATTQDSPLRAVSISGAIPTALAGAGDPLAIQELSSFGLGAAGGSSYQDTLALLYAPPRPFAEVAGSALQAIDLLAAANPTQFAPEHGARYPNSELGSKLLQAAQLIKADLGVEVLCLDVGGWDHHENLPNFLPGALADLCEALAAFDTDLGTAMADVTVIVQTEFGRRAGENGARGTDHGTAGLLWLLGGAVMGGRVVGDWPGLAPEQLAAGEDLAITVDTRDVLAEFLSRRRGHESALVDVFPEHAPGAAPGVFLPRGG
ncbi:DUF1501 domain-containing protein [Algiphilus sp.]|uniref:DUF1501 domain-containing protein n=1 Tax=Algiphilus sp. TaxID=1872431 RepID=UPI003B52367B